MGVNYSELYARDLNDDEWALMQKMLESYVDLKAKAGTPKQFAEDSINFCEKLLQNIL